MAKHKTVTLSEVAHEGVNDEYGDYFIYKHLANSYRRALGQFSRTRRNKLADVFEKLSETEYKHYEFWRKYSPNTEAKVSKLKLYGIIIFAAIFGATFAVKFLERHEESTIRQYKAIDQYIPQEDKSRFEEMVRDEQEQEVDLAQQVQSSFVKYMSFIVLGLADAIVEISGINAGSLGVYKLTKFTGLAGIIAGAAASMAMASAAYAQAKQGFQGSARISAVLTGVSYFANAVFLASPYFLLRNAVDAMSASLSIAVFILAFISYYNSIISSAHFVRDFLELAGIMFGATIVLFFFGEAMRAYFGISIH